MADAMGESVDLKQLDALANVPLTVSVGGRELAVTPIRVAELPAMVRACEPIFALLAGGDVLDSLVRDPDSAINAIAIGARIPRAELDALELDELVLLGGAVLQVNADFFARRLAPAFITASEKVTAALAGSMPSLASFAPGSSATM